jgi:Plant mobile domain
LSYPKMNIGSIFKCCLPTQMMTPFDGANFTTSMNLFCWYTWVLTYFYRYTQAFCLNLFGSVMFPNNNTDSVPTIYLTFFDDMLNILEDRYDWGQAILSCLYFNLSQSCLEPTDCIAGPLLSFQIWSWTWFPIGRPR